MTKIQQGRYDQLLRRVADLKGPGSKVNDVLEELFPIFDVENRNAELALIGGWRLAMGSTVLPGVAANLRFGELRNPADSGYLIVPTRIWISPGSTQNVEWELIGEPALTEFTVTARVLDTRLGVTSSPVGQIRSSTQVAGAAGFGNFFLVTGTPFPFQDDGGICVLAPGSGIVFANTTVNTSLTLQFLWRERIAEPSELNF